MANEKYFPGLNVTLSEYVDNMRTKKCQRYRLGSIVVGCAPFLKGEMSFLINTVMFVNKLKCFLK